MGLALVPAAAPFGRGGPPRRHRDSGRFSTTTGQGSCERRATSTSFRTPADGAGLEARTIRAPTSVRARRAAGGPQQTRRPSFYKMTSAAASWLLLEVLPLGSGRGDAGEDLARRGRALACPRRLARAAWHATSVDAATDAAQGASVRVHSTLRVTEASYHLEQRVVARLADRQRLTSDQLSPLHKIRSPTTTRAATSSSTRPGPSTSLAERNRRSRDANPSPSPCRTTVSRGNAHWRRPKHGGAVPLRPTVRIRQFPPD